MRISDWSSDVCSSDLQRCGKCGASRISMDRYTTRLWVALAPLWPLSIPILWTNPVGCIRWLTYRRGSAASPLTSQGMAARSEEHTSELQSLMRISYDVFCLKNKNKFSLKKKQNEKQQRKRI